MSLLSIKWYCTDMPLWPCSMPLWPCLHSNGTLQYYVHVYSQEVHYSIPQCVQSSGRVKCMYHSICHHQGYAQFPLWIVKMALDFRTGHLHSLHYSTAACCTCGSYNVQGQFSRVHWFRTVHVPIWRKLHRQISTSYKTYWLWPICCICTAPNNLSGLHEVSDGDFFLLCGFYYTYL